MIEGFAQKAPKSWGRITSKEGKKKDSLGNDLMRRDEKGMARSVSGRFEGDAEDMLKLLLGDRRGQDMEDARRCKMTQYEKIRISL